MKYEDDLIVEINHLVASVHFWIFDKDRAWEEYAMKWRAVIVIEVVFIIVILSDDVVMNLVAI